MLICVAAVQQHCTNRNRYVTFLPVVSKIKGTSTFSTNVVNAKIMVLIMLAF